MVGRGVSPLSNIVWKIVGFVGGLCLFLYFLDGISRPSQSSVGCLPHASAIYGCYIAREGLLLVRPCQRDTVILPIIVISLQGTKNVYRLTFYANGDVVQVHIEL